MRRGLGARTWAGLAAGAAVLVALVTLRYGWWALAFGVVAAGVAVAYTMPWEGLRVVERGRDAVVGGVLLDALRPGVSEHTGPQCDGGPCPAHNQSRHHMLGWPQLHGRVMNLTVRECPHGGLHPDPDDVRWLHRDVAVHDAECDGCCRSAP